MRNAIIRFLATFLVFLLIFILQKPLFVAVYHSLYPGLGFGGLLSVIWHGLAVDLSMAAYLTLIPGLLTAAALVMDSHWIVTVGRIYAGLVSFILALITVVDLVLYDYWGFRLDATPLFYFISSPSSAMASAGTGEIIGGALGILVLTALFYLIQAFVAKKIAVIPEAGGRRKIRDAACMVLLTALLIIPIRGGFTVSTMNPSRAYFSTDPRLNHAAMNPAFSFLYSVSHQNDFGSQFRFMDDTVAHRLFASMSRPEERPDTALLNTARPDIWLIIAESFSSHLMPSLGGEPVAMRLDSIAAEGLLFTEFYASSFRTDRALPAILAAFPGQPNTSLMKFVNKTENLPSIPRSLRAVGYDTQYYYGGDINFTNMLAFLKNAGIERTVSDSDFPLAKKASKWGVNDSDLLDRVIADMQGDTVAGPRLRVVQTSSSHEPFDVPYRSRFEDKRLNAFAYADSCIGALVEAVRRSPRWERTLVIIVPDHWGVYPRELTDQRQRHRIPLVMTGGALALRGAVPTVGSQTDIAATLLGAMGIPHDEFIFSNDMLASQAPHFAFYSSPSAMGYVTAADTVEYDLDNDSPRLLRGQSPDAALKNAKAYLQNIYDTLSRL